jgi:ubiquinone/menaquinone biosynthesis C-methylase UbiE
MDEPGADPRTLRDSLRFIRLVNGALGYTRATLHHLERFSRRWKKGETIRIVDLATGSADVPRAILKWADRRGFQVQIVGVDRHPVTIAAAAEEGADARLTLAQADVFKLPFEDGSFDYALCSMFLHHLDEEDAVKVLATMGRLARQGIVCADVLRHRRAYAWITFFTLFANPIVKHDARVSVAQAFTKNEVLRMRDGAGINFAQYYRHFGHRFVLAGEKG